MSELATKILRQTAASLSAFPANNLTALTYKALLTRDSQVYEQALAELPVFLEPEKLKEQEKENALKVEREKALLKNPQMRLVAATFVDFPVAKLLMNLPDYNATIHVVKLYAHSIVVVLSSDKVQELFAFLRSHGADCVDLALVPNLKEKGAFVSDMDSTMVTCECIDRIASLCGIEEQVAAITEEAMQGKLDFAASLRQRVALLKGVNVQDFDTIIATLPYTVGASELLKALNSKEWQTALVSGGFIPFAQAVSQELGFSEFHANTLGQDQGVLTGVVEGAIVDADYKAQIVDKYQQQGLTTIAIGDGANDIAMLKAADFSVAYHAKPVVNEVADFIIQHNDLYALLAILEIKAWLL
ncbi:phosphoserine phosphatase SerB [Psittacicella melopsittaci]|uniref:Phosphoserine phosphatase n=1 Tax=Psittacicella melopsittaci TaxID=2028576 RepID=A0A3A1Y7Z0_9GAMM|nr:phosphoserine phosphatase SerB [Psittacicella melopsittaci]RIY33641.1 phosphoserine phosphatase SerB [Psittacicella melopsittaci]